MYVTVRNKDLYLISRNKFQWTPRYNEGFGSSLGIRYIGIGLHIVIWRLDCTTLKLVHNYLLSTMYTSNTMVSVLLYCTGIFTHFSSVEWIFSTHVEIEPSWEWPRTSYYLQWHLHLPVDYSAVMSTSMEYKVMYYTQWWAECTCHGNAWITNSTSDSQTDGDQDQDMEDAKSFFSHQGL